MEQGDKNEEEGIREYQVREIFFSLVIRSSAALANVPFWRVGN